MRKWLRAIGAWLNEPLGSCAQPPIHGHWDPIETDVLGKQQRLVSDRTSRVLATIRRYNSDGTWWASVDGRLLGEFVDYVQAKRRAEEKAIRE